MWNVGQGHKPQCDISKSWTVGARLVNVAHLGTVRWVKPFLSNLTRRMDGQTHGAWTDRLIGHPHFANEQQINFL